MLALVFVLVVGYAQIFHKNEPVISSENTQIKQTDRKFSGESFLSVTENSLNLYFRKGGENEYIHYLLENKKKSLDKNETASNYDIWNIISVSHVKATKYGGFRNINQIVSDGEWFFAAREEKANDFIGGHHHGDDHFKDVEITIDGKDVDMTQKGEYKDFTELKLSYTSEVSRDNTVFNSGEPVIERKNEVLITGDLVTSNQKVEFLDDIQLQYLYLTMLPILRNNGGSQITSSVNFHGKTYDVSKSGFKHADLQFKPGDEILISGDTYRAKVNVKIQQEQYTTKLLASNSEAYNKLYFSVINENTDFAKGDIINATSNFMIEF